MEVFCTSLLRPVGGFTPHNYQPRKETSMKVLNTTNTSTGLVTCALINRSDARILAAFWKKRTRIWTIKYGEHTDTHGYEIDADDAHASVVVHFSVVHGEEKVLGGYRLIYANDGNTLPVGACADRPIVGPAVEVSRFFLAPNLRSTDADRQKLIVSLVESIESVLCYGGHDCAFATIRSSLFETLTRMGIPMVRIGPNQAHGGKQFIPAKMFARNPVQALLRMQQFNAQHAHKSHALAA